MSAVTDPFDALMNRTCSVLAKGNGSVDDYGIESQTFSTLATNVPCRVSTDAIGRPHEYKAGTKASLNYRRVFMRPPTLSGGVTFSPHHWLQIDGVNYDIFEILPLYELSALHHLEVIVEDVKP